MTRRPGKTLYSDQCCTALVDMAMRLGFIVITLVMRKQQTKTILIEILPPHTLCLLGWEGGLQIFSLFQKHFNFDNILIHIPTRYYQCLSILFEF